MSHLPELKDEDSKEKEEEAAMWAAAAAAEAMSSQLVDADASAKGKGRGPGTVNVYYWETKTREIRRKLEELGQVEKTPFCAFCLPPNLQFSRRSNRFARLRHISKSNRRDKQNLRCTSPSK